MSSSHACGSARTTGEEKSGGRRAATEKSAVAGPWIPRCQSACVPIHTHHLLLCSCWAQGWIIQGHHQYSSTRAEKHQYDTYGFAGSPRTTSVSPVAATRSSSISHGPSSLPSLVVAASHRRNLPLCCYARRRAARFFILYSNVLYKYGRPVLRSCGPTHAIRSSVALAEAGLPSPGTPPVKSIPLFYGLAMAS